MKKNNLTLTAVIGLIFAVLIGFIMVVMTLPRSVIEDESAAGLVLAAHYATSMQEMERASGYYTRAIDKYPGDDIIRTQSFITHISAGEITRALPIAPELLGQNNAESVIAWITLIADAIKAEDVERIAYWLAQKPKVHAGLNLIPVLQGWNLFLTDADETANFLQSALYDGKLGGIINFQIALIFEAMGNISEAKKAFMRGVWAGGMEHQAFAVHYGAFLERIGETENAHAIYRAFLRNKNDIHIQNALDMGDSKDERAAEEWTLTAYKGLAWGLYALAEAMRDGGHTGLAVAYLQIALYLDPRITAAHMLHAQILETYEKWDQAAHIYGKVEEGNIYAHSAHVAQANMLEKAGQYETSITMFKKLKKQFPQDLEIVLSLANVYRMNKDCTNAEPLYDDIIEKLEAENRNIWTPYMLRGLCRDLLGRWEAAEQDFIKAVALSNETPVVLNALGYVWVDRGKNLQEAFAMIEQAVEKEPDNGYFIDSLGWAFYRMGDFENAVMHLERASSLEPLMAIISSHLGDALWHSNRKVEARYQWHKALAFEPDDKLRTELEQKLLHGAPPAQIMPETQKAPEAPKEKTEI